MVFGGVFWSLGGQEAAGTSVFRSQNAENERVELGVWAAGREER